MRCWKYILKRKTPTIILTSIPVLFMLKLSMNVSAGIVITNESYVRSRFTPAPVLLPQKNHRTRRIPPGTALSDSPAARRKYTQWRHPRGFRRCSSDGTAWDQCPDTRRTCSRWQVVGFCFCPSPAFRTHRCGQSARSTSAPRPRWTRIEYEISFPTLFRRSWILAIRNFLLKRLVSYFDTNLFSVYSENTNIIHT